MSKYIDAEKLIAEIKKLMEERNDLRNEIVRYCFEILDIEDNEILSIIDSLQWEQPEIELDKFANKVDAFTERYKNNPERISIKGAMAFMARMFYQYPSVAREWYENLPKATMD